MNVLSARQEKYRIAPNYRGTKTRETLKICEIFNSRIKNFVIAAKFREAYGEALLWLWYHA